jgi:hypothetical protein
MVYFHFGLNDASSRALAVCRVPGRRPAMRQASALKPIALVIEDDLLQRQLVVALLEESEMGVIEATPP